MRRGPGLAGPDHWITVREGIMQAPGRCINCTNILMGFEARGELCNACLAIPREDSSPPSPTSHWEAIRDAATVEEEVDAYHALVDTIAREMPR